MSSSRLCLAVADGDTELVERLLRSGVDVSELSSEGFAPLCIAAFWGFAQIAKLLLDHGADPNVTNRGTGWTPCHCAAFQGHGKVLLHLIQRSPDTTIRDAVGRTASDFGSAHDTIWPFFASMGCSRTPKTELLQLDIIKKVADEGTAGRNRKGLPQQKKISPGAHLSRPGSAYVLQPPSQSVRADLEHSSRKQSAAAALAFGDVLREES